MRRVDGNAAHRGDRTVHRAQRPFIGRHPADFAEKDIGLVMIEQLAPVFGVTAHPVFDDIGADLMRLVNPAPNKFDTDRAVIMPICTAIADAQIAAIR